MIERIQKYYSIDGCVQLNLSFLKNITVFDKNIYKDGVICHYDFTDNSQNVNKYLLDSRKDAFPYADIPMYRGLFGRYYVNVLFEYNKHYICISDGFVRDRYVVREDDGDILLNRRLSIPMGINYDILPRDDIRKILEGYKSFLFFDNFGRRYSYDVDSLNNIDKFIAAGGGLFLYNDKNNVTSVRLIRIANDIGYDNYSYKEFDLSLNDYTVEELKYFSSKIRDIKDISICSLVNPNIDNKVIRENKSLVKSLRKNERM